MSTKNKPAKKRMGRPPVLDGTTRNFTLRLPEATYNELQQRAAQYTLDFGQRYTVSDVVRLAIKSELFKK